MRKDAAEATFRYIVAAQAAGNGKALPRAGSSVASRQLLLASKHSIHNTSSVECWQA